MKNILILLFAFLLMHSVHAQTTKKDKQLFDAVKSNDIEAVKSSVKKGANVNARDENLATPLMWAAFKGDLELVKYLIGEKANPKLKGVIYLDNGGYYGNLTGIATGENKLELLRYLIGELKINPNDVEYNPDTKKDDGWNALEWAISKNNMNIVQYLLKNGANADFISASDGSSLLSYAWSEWNNKIAKVLIEHGADINRLEAGGWSTVHLAVNALDKESLQLLIEKKAELNAQLTVEGYEGWTPLFLAAFHGNMDFIKLLLEAGADPAIKDKKGLTAWDLEDQMGYTPVLKAFNKKGKEFAQFFIEKGALIKTKNSDLYLDLYSALKKKNFDKVKELIQNGADVNSRFRHQNSVLQYALDHKKYEFATFFLEQGAYAETFNKKLYIDFHKALRSHDREQVKMLIKKGADLNAKYEYDETPLHLACEDETSLETIKLLVEHGAKVNTQDALKYTVLHLACYIDNGLEIVKFLTENGADPNISDEEGNLPLHFLCEIENAVETAVFLIEHGTNINFANNEKNTPLHFACENENIEMVKLLLENNADVNVKNIWNETPLYLAEDIEDEEMVKLLKQYGAK